MFQASNLEIVNWFTRIDSTDPFESCSPDRSGNGHVLIVAVAVDRRQHLSVDKVDANLERWKLKFRFAFAFDSSQTTNFESAKLVAIK
jgi:hypothetical protein